MIQNHQNFYPQKLVTMTTCFVFFQMSNERWRERRVRPQAEWHAKCADVSPSSPYSRDPLLDEAI